ncbi:MAG: ABC transporter ATP-binding protein [Cyanobacteria bacterium P01_H01_bin.15]
MCADLFRLNNLRIAYPQAETDPQTVHWSVDDVSISLNPGDRLGLVGESGCGKSTLGRAAMRLLPRGTQVEGSVYFKGESVFELTTSQLREFRGEVVALVFQDPMTRLDPLMTIGEHCLETVLAHNPQLSKAAAKEKAVQTLAAVKIPADRWNQYPHEFSGGMRQRVAIALALVLNPKVIVADEPTTALDVTVAAEILQELTRLCTERGVGLLLISHDLAMVGQYCDRLAVMYQGKLVETGNAKEIFRNPQHPYTQSLLTAALHISVDEEAPLIEEISSAPILLEAKELQQHYVLESNFLQQLLGGGKQVIKAVDNVNFSLYKGEILGLVGESGCGKSTLSRTLLQLVRPTYGQVIFADQDLAALPENQLRPLRRELQMVFQDPHACLNPRMNVAESIADPLIVHGLATPERAQVKVSEMLTRVGLTPIEEYSKRYPKDLSGGQQQRVAIARALITHPQLVICDEPVSMLDASVQSQVLELMLELKEEFDLTYLFITHDLWVARFFCDRIAVMNKGQIVELGPTEQIFRQPQDPYTQSLLKAAPLLDFASP